MDIEVSACELLTLLRGFKPRGRARSFREPNVRATAGGNMLILMGSFDNSTSIPVKVNLPGSAGLPLDPALRLLSTYKGDEVIRIRADGAWLWIGQVKLPLL